MSVLNIKPGANNAYIRFMPSLNAWLLGKEEVQLGEFILDYQCSKTGWGCLQEGAAPDWVWDSQLGVQGRQPSSEHKRGFSVRFHIASIGTVDWSSTGTGSVMGLDTIFEMVWNERDAHPGMVPLVEYVGSKPLKVGKGNTRVPLFRIIKWVPRSSVPLDPPEPSGPRSSEAAAAN